MDKEKVQGSPEFNTLLVDDEQLEDRIPYKLEPSMSEIEDYLRRIRRGGL
jgi:hypothetical protein